MEQVEEAETLVIYVLNLYVDGEPEGKPFTYDEIVEVQRNFTRQEMIARMIVPKRKSRPIAPVVEPSDDSSDSEDCKPLEQVNLKHLTSYDYLDLATIQ